MLTQAQVKLGLSFDLALVPQHLMSLLLRFGGILGGLHALCQLGTAPLPKDKTHLGQGLCSQPSRETADVEARSLATEMTRKELERADGVGLPGRGGRGSEGEINVQKQAARPAHFAAFIERCIAEISKVRACAVRRS